jgi:hypothetical protein
VAAAGAVAAHTSVAAAADREWAEAVDEVAAAAGAAAAGGGAKSRRQTN